MVTKINYKEMDLEVLFFQDGKIVEIYKIIDWQGEDVTDKFDRDSIKDIEDEVRIIKPKEMKIEVQEYRNEGETTIFYALMKDGKTINVFDNKDTAIETARRLKEYPAYSKIIYSVEL
jgi:hypothetical protein